MDAAVAQLGVVEVYLLGAFAGLTGDSGHGLAGLLALLDFAQDYVGCVEVLVEVVVKLLLEEVADEFRHSGPVWPHVARAEFCLGLRLEFGVLDLDGNRGHHAGADVGVFEVLGEVILHRAADSLLEGRQMGAPLGGELAVDE